jgi:hypothetical protein
MPETLTIGLPIAFHPAQKVELPFTRNRPNKSKHHLFGLLTEIVAEFELQCRDGAH